MSTVGQDEGIDHGTPRGARQHVRRKVPMCDPCQEARTTEQEATAREANVGREAAFNRGPITREQQRKSTADKALSGARQVTAARELTAWERRRTARLLAGAAADRGDLVELLAAVGVTAADGKAQADAPSILTTTSSAPGGC